MEQWLHGESAGTYYLDTLISHLSNKSLYVVISLLSNACLSYIWYVHSFAAILWLFMGRNIMLVGLNLLLANSDTHQSIILLFVMFDSKFPEKFVVSKSTSLYLTVIGWWTVTFGYECHKILRNFPRKFSQEAKTSKLFVNFTKQWYSNTIAAISIGLALYRT